MRRTLHIALLAVLGVYYNGAPAVWVAYTTFAHRFFIERCENPGDPHCMGRCQVKHIATHSGQSNSSTHELTVADPQPTIPTSFSLIEPPRLIQEIFVLELSSLLSGIPTSPFHPPKS